MRVVYKEGEKELLEERFEFIKKHGALFGEDDPEATYGMTFKVTNPAIAQYILVSLLNNKLEDFDIGIDIQSIEFDVFTKKHEMKERLHAAIEAVFAGEVAE